MVGFFPCEVSTCSVGPRLRCTNPFSIGHWTAIRLLLSVISNPSWTGKISLEVKGYIYPITDLAFHATGFYVHWWQSERELNAFNYHHSWPYWQDSIVGAGLLIHLCRENYENAERIRWNAECWARILAGVTRQNSTEINGALLIYASGAAGLLN